MRRTVAFSWPSTLWAVASSSHTTDRPPTRSPYSEKIFEKELLTRHGTPARAISRIA
ncbi:hypothetical protein D9M71_665460 [compost metagenome]